jgi:hypothetical protein
VSLVVSAPESCGFHAQNPSNDDSFEVLAVSSLAGVCSSAGDLIALDAIGEGPSLFRADTTVTSLSVC